MTDARKRSNSKTKEKYFLDWKKIVEITQQGYEESKTRVVNL